MVIDSTDRERLSITKEELYKMLNHEVKYDSFKEIIYLVFLFFFIPPANKVWGGGYIVITLSVCPSVQLILSRIGGVMYLVNATPPKRLIGVL
jgi:hypothetical protein